MDRSDLVVLEGGKMDKKQALEQALAQIDKTFGKGSIMRLGANDKVDIEAISTGSLGPRHRARHRRPAEGPRHRDLWA